MEERDTLTLEGKYLSARCYSLLNDLKFNKTKRRVIERFGLIYLYFTKNDSPAQFRIIKRNDNIEECEYFYFQLLDQEPNISQKHKIGCDIFKAFYSVKVVKNDYYILNLTRVQHTKDGKYVLDRHVVLSKEHPLQKEKYKSCFLS